MPLLFSYGTLQQRDVQLATYGRLLQGEADAVLGYRLQPLAITDPDVVRLSGKAVHMIAYHTGDPADRITGLRFEISDDELLSSDRYEVDAYSREEVQLESGARAFVYVGMPLAKTHSPRE
jgi:gamma-glutamyl AIG2-like cyclotransferase